MQRLTITNLLLLLCGLAGGYGSLRGIQQGEWPLGSAIGLFSISLVVLSLLEIASGQPLQVLLSHPDRRVRRASVVGFGISLVGMCALCLAAVVQASGIVRIAGIVGLLLFGAGGAYAVVAYWHAPAKSYFDTAISRATSSPDRETDEH